MSIDLARMATLLHSLRTGKPETYEKIRAEINAVNQRLGVPSMLDGVRAGHGDDYEAIRLRFGRWPDE